MIWRPVTEPLSSMIPPMLPLTLASMLMVKSLGWFWKSGQVSERLVIWTGEPGGPAEVARAARRRG